MILNQKQVLVQLLYITSNSSLGRNIACYRKIISPDASNVDLDPTAMVSVANSSSQKSNEQWFSLNVNNITSSSIVDKTPFSSDINLSLGIDKAVSSREATAATSDASTSYSTNASTASTKSSTPSIDTSPFSYNSFKMSESSTSSPDTSTPSSSSSDPPSLSCSKTTEVTSVSSKDESYCTATVDGDKHKLLVELLERDDICSSVPLDSVYVRHMISVDLN